MVSNSLATIVPLPLRLLSHFCQIMQKEESMESVTEAMRSASVNHTTHERSSFVVVCFRSSSVESTQH
ncbi:hypothetical protein HanHA300_Chr01g0034371 [Helianthus annuus]|nr:hypothetical protein HanHA300_Chr01g0034371 [Helianthus annuus]KAJ0628475.1 hypothetical protein HanHA89_Chr01g0036981 [Helianthus annuus]KAJ0784758.1 hypothetical protein HanLR1_Chr01g0035441 [Helianthus annuus]